MKTSKVCRLATVEGHACRLADIPQQQCVLFGIRVPKLRVYLDVQNPKALVEGLTCRLADDPQQQLDLHRIRFPEHSALNRLADGTHEAPDVAPLAEN